MMPRQQTAQLATAIGSDLGVDPTLFQSLLSQTLGRVRDRVAGTEAGGPVSDELRDVIADASGRFADGRSSGATIGWDSLPNPNIAVFGSLVYYRDAWSGELQTMVEASLLPAEANPLLFEPEIDAGRSAAWRRLELGLDASPASGSLRLAPESGSEMPVDPADGVVAMARSQQISDGPLPPATQERDQWILRGLAIDDDASMDVSATYEELIATAETQIESRQRRRLVFAVIGALVAILGVILMVLTRSEVLQRRRIETAHDNTMRQLSAKVTVDPMTGVWNRRRLDVRVADLLARRREVGPLVLAYVDLDRFKAINDVWGHTIGDEILTIAAQRLARVTFNGKPVEVVRSGGDEFVCYVTVTSSEVRQARSLGDRLIAAISEPMDVEGREHRVGATAGLSVSDEASTSESLLLEADSSLILAKRNRRGSTSVYNRTSSRSSALVRALPEALSSGQIYAAFQPVFDVRTGRVAHSEALARWRRHDDAIVNPCEFVPLVESFGLASQLTDAVLAAVVSLQRSSQVSNQRVWINIAPVSLETSDFAPRLIDSLHELGGRPASIGIEITETAAIGDPKHFALQLEYLRNAGFLTAIDDFGSGYSPLGYLRSLPVDMVKLDRCLIDRVDRDDANQRIIEGVIALTSRLGMKTVAEGIERPEELAWVCENGIDYAQGFLLGAPASPQDIVWEATLESVNLQPRSRVPMEW